MWIWGVSAVVLGAGIYFLSKDDEEPIILKYDPAVHTIDKLRLIIQEIYIEGATLYCQKLRLIREQKKDGEFKGQETLDNLLEK